MENPKELPKWCAVFGLTPDTPKQWEKGWETKLYIIIASIPVCLITIGIPALMLYFVSASKICVPENKYYESGSGIC